MEKIRFGFQRFTSCGGCQLTLLNCEDEIVPLEKILDVVDFSIIQSGHPSDTPLDILLVEGSITSVAELERLLQARQRSRFLVAVGACALSGGVNAVKGGRESYGLGAVVTDSATPGSFPPQAIANFVTIDGMIPGCPPEGGEFLKYLGALLHHGFPAQSSTPVCMECRLRENLCLLIEEKKPCLGAVTRGGCSARCPSHGVICEGCRGAVPEANISQHLKLLLETGLSLAEARGRLERFVGRDDEGHSC